MVELVRQNLKENKKKYKIVEKLLKEKLGNKVSVDHVGSTAIPNMYGKNIIDVLVGTADEKEFKKIKNEIASIGFIESEKSKTNIYQFFASKEEETSSGDIHIHLVIKNTEKYNDFLLLKYYLLNNKQEAKNYSKFKQTLLNNIQSREEYKKEKSKYVSKLLEEAQIFNSINN